MLIFYIEGPPVPWKAHGGYGRKSFNLRYEERRKVQWEIKEQLESSFIGLIEGAVSVTYTYFVPIPKSFSHKKRRLIRSESLFPITRPDYCNYNKFLDDCLTGLVIKDDSQIVECHAKKLYGEKPHTVIRIDELITQGDIQNG